MTESTERSGAGAWNYWRIARWTAALALLLTPAVMMQISDEWHWTLRSFVAAGVVIGGNIVERSTYAALPSDVQAMTAPEQNVVYHMITGIAGGLSRLTPEEGAAIRSNIDSAKQILGAKGVERVVAIQLTGEEKAMLDKSAEAVRGLIADSAKL